MRLPNNPSKITRKVYTGQKDDEGRPHGHGTMEYSAGSGGVDTDITVRPAAPLNFIFSGDPERPFGIPEAGEPGFSGTIEAGIHLPLSGSDGILIK